MNYGIYYFSSTGNSLYIAEELKKAVGGEINYITADKNPSDYDTVIIVSPIYSYGLPVHVYDFITALKTDKPVYIVLNYGGMKKGAEAFAYNLCKSHNLDIKAVISLKMPENFTLTFQVPQFYLDSALKKAPARITDVAEKILSGYANQKYKINKKAEKTHFKNKGNWHLIGERFTVDDSCVKCGKCIAVCPAGNIELKEGKIVFSNKCVACLGCYHRCPYKAINYKNKTKKNKRYINPFIDENDIGK